MTVEMISVEAAIDALVAARPCPGSCRVPLHAAHGQVLAEPVIARTTLPPRAVSAMDGYAVRLEDVQAGAARLRMIGEAPAGRPFAGSLGAGEAVRIFTGGALPEGGDHVVIQEHTQRDGAEVLVPAPETGPRHIRAKGLDFSAGDTLLPVGTYLGPAEIAVAAAGNHGALCVRRPLKVAILANGDELREPGSDLAQGEIVSSNTPALAALVRAWGGEPMALGIAPDNQDAIVDRIRAARAADIILAVGGASVGDHDHMRGAFSAHGAREVFAKVAVRPGKPTWFAQLGEQRILGLPGNPASAFVCAHLFLGPLMGQVAAPRLLPARLGVAVGANGPRESYLRAQRDHEGRVSPLADQDSSLLTPFLRADCLLRRPAHAPEAEAGERACIVALRDKPHVPGA